MIKNVKIAMLFDFFKVDGGRIEGEVLRSGSKKEGSNEEGNYKGVVIKEGGVLKPHQF